MALPSSGAISLLALQNEYGGSSPISLSEYYRNGAYVPNSITSTVREPSSGEYYTNGSYMWVCYAGTANETILLYWAGADLGAPYGFYTSVTIGGYTYYRGSFRETTKIPSWDYYGIYRTSSSTIYVNQSVPTSGTISLSNFYGGRKT